MELSDIEDIEKDFLTCEICEELAFHDETDFHILQCQHTICEGCVDSLVEKKKNHEPLLCPWCRQEFSIPEDGKLPTFRFAANLFAALQVLKKKKPPAKPKLKKVKTPNQDQKKQAARITPLNAFNYETIFFKIHVAGRDGKFYGKHSGDGKGLSYINILSDGRVIRFGNMQSVYPGMVFIDGELYAFNETQGYIEVYRNEELTRSWHVQGSNWITRFFWTYFYANLVCVSKLDVSPGNQICLSYAVHNDIHLVMFSQHGQPVSLAKPNPRWENQVVRLLTCCKQFHFQSSVWILNLIDDHLWEIPVEEIGDEISYTEPIKHCKIGKCSSCCQLEEGKILFTIGKLVKVVNLAEFCSQRNENTRSASRSRQQGHADKEVKPAVHNLLTSVYQEDRGLVVSEDGYVVMYDDEGITSYKLDQQEKEVPPQPLTLSHTIISGPEYPTYREIVSRTCDKYFQKAADFVDLVASTFIKAVLLMVLVAYYCQYSFAQALTDVCNDIQPFGGSYGWANLYVSLCENPQCLSRK